MPVDITLSNGTTDTTYTIVIDSATQMFHIATLGVFDWFALDRSEKISDAITDDEITVNAVATTNLPETFTSINSIAVPVSGSLVRLEHNWVAPDGFKNSNPGIRLSNYRYWTINGHFKPGYHAKATFTYDGRTIANTGHLDNTLGIIIEDSLVLVYRNGSGDDWKIIPQTTNFNGSHVDRFGTITIDSLMRGEYALGYYDYTVGVPSIAQAAKTYTLTVSPNPTNKICNIAFTLNNLKQATIAITNMLGAVVKVYTVYAHQEQVSWDAADMPAGTYICLTSGDKILNSEKLILTK
nr:T9SS type A sorting domain-containing protein [Bacteroidota bacterium]